MHALVLIAVVVFATGVFLGFFVTGFIIPGPASWWIPAAIRVAWQLGGSILLAVAIVRETGGLRERAGWATIAGLALFGALLCVNPIRDLVAGPVDVRGRLAVDVHKRGKGISADISVAAADGSVVTFNPSGLRVNVVQDELSACDGKDDVRVVGLRHLDVVLAVECAG